MPPVPIAELKAEILDAAVLTIIVGWPEPPVLDDPMLLSPPVELTAL